MCVAEVLHVPGTHILVRCRSWEEASAGRRLAEDSNPLAEQRVSPKRLESVTLVMFVKDLNFDSP